MIDLKQLAAHVEAVLFSSGDPLTAEKICAALGVTKRELNEAVEYLSERYSQEDSGIELLRLNDAYQLAVKKQFASDVKAVLEIKKGATLSPAAMEVLTIAAYNQPVTKAFVEHVRGVDSSSVVNSLVEKDLLCETGRLNLPGRPVAYKTTDNFLRAFGLSSLDELPPLPDRREQLSFDDAVVEQAEEPSEE
ncbi:segregation and condensation protein B [Ruminococcus sp. YE71]|uniref:SMC-Scp complex subunit ScpB n=1 Tax=unclassified Ruminococcus TaxID=2608920 RepID=UPI0008833C69|nr:segregation and condensation protein B [Ruminococcus sp. YE78]SFW23052.1 segregation and condensation protein B [Ruminococcus sp. YE71]